MPVESGKETVRIRMKDPGRFQKESFRTITINAKKGIKAVIGKLKGETKTTTQNFMFAKDQGWDVKRAKKWVKDIGS